MKRPWGIVSYWTSVQNPLYATPPQKKLLKILRTGWWAPLSTDPYKPNHQSITSLAYCFFLPDTSSWLYPGCAKKILATSGKTVILCTGGKPEGYDWISYSEVFVYDPPTKTFALRPEWKIPEYGNLYGTATGRVFWIWGDRVLEFRDERQTPDGSHWHPVENLIKPAVASPMDKALAVSATAIRMKRGGQHGWASLRIKWMLNGKVVRRWIGLKHIVLKSLHKSLE